MLDKVKVFKALSSESRLKIVRLLKEHPQCVNAIAKRLGMTQSAVSQHLRILKEAGLVRGLKRGNWMHYEMPVESLKNCGRVLAEVFGVGIKLKKITDGNLNCPPSLLKDCRTKTPGGKRTKGGKP
ncbi:MAG: metalloregulator ArsR/SmtB family transcription factor [Candidatus Aminicenantales bacterium]